MQISSGMAFTKSLADRSRVCIEAHKFKPDGNEPERDATEIFKLSTLFSCSFQHCTPLKLQIFPLEVFWKFQSLRNPAGSETELLKA